MSIQTYFNPLNPDAELEASLQAPVTVDSLEILAHDTQDGVYSPPPYVHPKARRRVLRPRKAKPITRVQAVDSLLDTKEYY